MDGEPVTVLDGTETTKGSSGSASGGRNLKVGQTHNQENDSGGDDTSGSADTGSTAGGESGQGAQEAGDTGQVEGQQQYEGVTADDFEFYAESMANFQGAMLASQAVMTFAIFFCMGVLAIQTFIRSLERD